MALDIHKTSSRRTPRYSLTPVEITRDIVNSKFYKDPLELLGEKSFGSPSETPEDEVGTPMQEFFRGKTLFITGGTGFMGKTLMEKILRSCPHIKHIYLLVRPKRGKDIQERVEAIFNDRLFWRLRTEVPSYRSIVSAIAGDCSLPGLGLNETDRELLVKTVNLVFHGAATVRFDEHIKMAVKINVCGVQAIVQLAKEMKQLKALLHVSTAFTHCPRLRIDERFYPTPVSYENLIQMINEKDEAELSEMTPKLLHEWPNTYTFTKALAEDVIAKEAKGLPVAIFRPAVIISTYREPVRGWIDNVYGPVGMMVGIGSGVLHTHLVDIDNVVDMVPVDLVVNAMIAAVWDTASTNKTEMTGIESTITDTKDNTESTNIPIYNYVSSAQNPITMREFMDMAIEKGSLLWPTERAIWYISFWPTTSLPLFFLLNFFLHTVPAFFLDNLARMTGRKPMLHKIYEKISAASETLHYFAIRRWTWTNNNIQRLFQKLDDEDQELFFFDMGQMSWEYYTEALGLGLRVYLVEDDISTLPAARKKWQRLYIAHCILKIVSVCVLVFLFLYIIAIVSGV